MRVLGRPRRRVRCSAAASRVRRPADRSPDKLGKATLGPGPRPGRHSPRWGRMSQAPPGRRVQASEVVSRPRVCPDRRWYTPRRPGLVHWAHPPGRPLRHGVGGFGRGPRVPTTACKRPARGSRAQTSATRPSPSGRGTLPMGPGAPRPRSKSPTFPDSPRRGLSGGWRSSRSPTPYLRGPSDPGNPRRTHVDPSATLTTPLQRAQTPLATCPPLYHAQDT